MKAVQLTIAALVFASSVSAQDPPSKNPSNLSDPAKCNIAGIVVKLSDSAPLNRAKVRLQAAEQRGKAWIAFTDVAGKFELKNVEPGRYTLNVSRNGFVTQEYGQKTPSDPGALLSLGPGQSMKDLLFRMLPSAVITGRVLDEDGEPLPNVQMSALRSGYFNGQRKLAPKTFDDTNDLGEYRLFGLPPGRYFISADYRPERLVVHNSPVIFSSEKEANEGYLPAYYPSTVDMGKATPIQVGAGEEIRSIDFVLVRTRVLKIRGKVFNAITQRPGANAFVQLTPRNNRIAWFFFGGGATANSPDGAFEISNVAPGSYWVRAHWSDEGKNYQSQQAVDVGTADVEGINLVIAPGTSLSGHVTWDGKESLSGGELRAGLRPAEDMVLSVGTVKSDGSFVLNNVSEGTYRVWVYGQSEDSYLKAAKYGSEEALDSGITVQRGGPNGTLEVVLSPNGARIEGSVTNADSLPAAGVWVVLVPEAARRNQEWLFKTATTDQNGRFVLRGIPPGEYKLFSWEEVEPGAWFDLDFLKPYESKGETVRVEEGGHASVDLKLIPADKPQEGR
ncbi:MAG TPA: carboxypeptidase-like regulatory domain-containing protein [Candidatus Acidoferrales bacterium]|nr:carboxypeptidase-like regulatory domain-containing protein [Candidatus Acidoferrales bacterium]